MKVQQRAILIAYKVLIGLSWPALYLYYFCRSRVHSKYRGNYRARMGLELPEPASDGPGAIWIHALSVGEVLSAVPLTEEFKKRCPELEIVFSVSTETGMAIAGERLSSWVSRFFFMPHDFPWAVKALNDRVRPKLFVLIETDFWPGLLHTLREHGVRTALVNGRISPRSYIGYLRLPWLAKTIFSGFDRIFAQTENDRQRFIALGSGDDSVSSAGNLKFDSSFSHFNAAGAADLRDSIGLVAGRPVWVAGSTHAGEEEILLRVHRKLRSVFPDPLLIIAPRNVERRNEIEVLCSKLGFACAARSGSEQAGGKAVYLLDTLGELAKFYSVCDAAFIGGSLVPFGGHNPLEAVGQGIPTCWGPHFFNFLEIETALLDSQCCARVHSEMELAEFLGPKFVKSGQGFVHDKGVLPFLRSGVSGTIASALIDLLDTGVSAK